MLDRPVSGATIGARNSATCGHMPDQRVVVTGLDGRAVVPDVAPSEGQDYANSWECWVVHPSIESDYRYLEFSSHHGPVQIFRHGPSDPVEGTIVDAEGKPAVGVHVGHMGAHRGPWTRTNSQGWFRLEGAPPGARLTVDSPGSPSGTEERWFTAPPPGFPRTFRMPPPGSAMSVPVTHPVKVLLRDSTSQQPIVGDVPLVAVRDVDGFTTDEGFEALPSGTWTLLAGGGASPWRPTRATLVVDAGPASIVLDVARNPDLRIEFSGDPATASVELVTASGVRQVTPEELTARVVPAPVDEECAFRVAYGGRDKHPETYLWLYTAVPKEARGEDAAPVRIANPAPVRIAASLAGPDGKPVPGWLASDLASLLEGATFASWIPETPAALTPEVPVYAEGHVDLLAIPEGSTLKPRVVHVTLPPHALEGGRVDAGVVRLLPRGDTRLTVLARDGTPADYEFLQIVRGHAVRTWFRGEDDEPVCDPRLDPLAPGDVVEVLRPAWRKCFLPPIRQRLEGPGPWTIRNDRPERSILVDPVDEGGKPLDATLVVDGTPVSTEAYTDEDGKRRPFEVAGLGAGPHRIALSAKDRLTRLWRVVLKEGERRTLSGVLRSRPPSPAPPK